MTQSQTIKTITAAATLLVALAFAADSLIAPDFGGFDPNRFPNPQPDPPLQPVGFAFAIWGPIYIWLIISALFGVIARRTDTGWQAFRPALIVSLLIGVPWLRVARENPALSTVMIWGMLIFALIALWRSPQKDRLWAREATGLYAGWLTAAAAVGSSVTLAGYGYMDSVSAAVVMLVLALAIGAAMIWKLPNLTLSYSAAILWALAGIIVERSSDPVAPMISLSAAGIVIIAAITVLRWRKSRAA